LAAFFLRTTVMAENPDYELCARECLRLAQTEGLSEADRQELIQVAEDFMREALAAAHRTAVGPGRLGNLEAIVMTRPPTEAALLPFPPYVGGQHILNRKCRHWTASFVDHHESSWEQFRSVSDAVSDEVARRRDRFFSGGFLIGKVAAFIVGNQTVSLAVIEVKPGHD